MNPRKSDVHLTERHLSVLRDVLRRHADQIEHVGVFGSRAGGHPRPNSDIDLIVHGRVDQALVDRLWTEFSESGLEVSVDVVGDGLIGHEALMEQIRQTEKPLFVQSDLNVS